MSKSTVSDKPQDIWKLIILQK